jgi:Fe-Mn family superoxide dismutase
MSDTHDDTRRAFLRASATVAVAAGAASTLKAQETVAIPSAFTTPAVQKPLSFDPTAIEGLSERLLTSHWQNNYGGSVNALNAIKQRLAAALADDAVQAFVYNDLKREHLLRTGSVVLHELYFDNIGSSARDSELDAALTSAFGGVATWEREFRRIGAGLGGGSGWVMLGWNRHARMLENYWMWDHMHGPPSTLPLLVMDMYEHSYAIDYGAATTQYLDAFMRNIRWSEVAARLEAALTPLPIA